MAKKKQSDEYKRLSKELTKLVSKANHRYDRMKKAGWESPATKTAKNTGGRFHNSRTMSYREMQKEHKRVTNYLNSKTSSKTGAKKNINKVLKATGLDKKYKTNDVMKNKKTLDKYFRVYNKMREYDRVKGIGRSYQASMNAVTTVFVSLDGGAKLTMTGPTTVDSILDAVIKSLDEPELYHGLAQSGEDFTWIGG